MTTIEKFRALACLCGGTCNASVKLADDGRWYVSLPGVSFVDGHLRNSPGFYSNSFDGAIDGLWEVVSKPRVVIETGRGYHVRWVGFMWEQTP